MEMILGFHLYLSFYDSSVTSYGVTLFQDWEHAAQRLEQVQSDMGDSFEKSRFSVFGDLDHKTYCRKSVSVC